jgi:hypothetical protein
MKSGQMPPPSPPPPPLRRRRQKWLLAKSLLDRLAKNVTKIKLQFETIRNGRFYE